jgi:hypothetical protein
MVRRYIRDGELFRGDNAAHGAGLQPERDTCVQAGIVARPNARTGASSAVGRQNLSRAQATRS